MIRRVAAVLSAGAILLTVSASPASAGLLVTANDDAYAAVHDRGLSVAAPGLLANDSGVLPSAARLTNPAHGTVTVNANGSFTYHPSAGYVGSDAFTYEARVLNLGILVTDPATVSLTVTNAVPTANDDAWTATTGVSLTVPAPGVLANDHDADGDALQALLVDAGGNGSLSLAANGGFTFKSGGSFVGTHTFTYRVSDGITTSALATVSIDVRTKTSTPPPTPAPTPAPTPPPTPSPTPAPTATPAPTLPLPTPTLPLPTLPLPTLPLPTPSLPLPTLPLPTLPFPTPTLPPTLPTPTPDPLPSGDPGSSPSTGPGAPTSPGASSSTDPGGAPSGAPGSTSSDAPPGAGTIGGSSGSSGSGTPAGAGDGGLAVGRAAPPPIDGLTDVNVIGLDGLIVWAVPSLALTVPGLLLVLAVLAQMVGATMWLPVIRRWLGGYGFRRRRARSASV